MNLEYLKDVAVWAWSEKEYLLGLYAKWSARASNEKFDGRAVKAALVEYEPLAWKIYGEGRSIPSVVAEIIFRKFGPRKLTPAEEEKAWLDRMAKLP